MNLSKGLTHTFCHMNGDVVGARQRVVVCSHAALHAVVGRALFVHFYFLPAGEPLGTVLLDCDFLLIPAASGMDDVDASNTDIGVDGLAGLDVEAGDGESAYVDNVDIGTAME